MATNTALCKEAGVLVCPVNQIYTGHIEGLAKNPTLLGKFIGFTGTVTCEHSLILGNALGLANPQITHLELLDFTGNCKSTFGGTCEVKATKLGLVKLLKTGPNLGTATSENNEVFVKCGGFPTINCTFGGSPVLHAVGTSAKAAELTATKAVLTGTGSNCPEGNKGEWDALYEVILPKPLYITE
jgi:hypothetical protein